MTDVPTDIRSSIADVDDGTGIILMFEPEVIKGRARAVYGGDPEIGAPFVEPIFSYTENEKFSLDIIYNRIILAHGGPSLKTDDDASAAIERSRNWIRSKLQPRRVPPGVVGGNPPLLAVMVPGVMACYCRLDDIEWEVTRRDRKTGRIMDMTARCNFTEDPSYRWAAEDLIEVGYDRLG